MFVKSSLPLLEGTSVHFASLLFIVSYMFEFPLKLAKVLAHHSRSSAYVNLNTYILKIYFISIRKILLLRPVPRSITWIGSSHEGSLVTCQLF